MANTYPPQQPEEEETISPLFSRESAEITFVDEELPSFEDPNRLPSSDFVNTSTTSKDQFLLNQTERSNTRHSTSSHHSRSASLSSAVTSQRSNSLHGAGSSHHHISLSTHSNSNNNNTLTPSSSAPSTQARKVYRKDGSKWVTREIAALDFLLGIPLAAEGEIVQQGWNLQQKKQQEDHLRRDDNEHHKHSDDDQDSTIPRDVILSATSASAVTPLAQGRWWEKWINHTTSHQQHGDNPVFLAATGNNPQSQQQQLDETELELPIASERVMAAKNAPTTDNNNNRNAVVPGRRLQGDEAVLVQIPLTTPTLTKQKTIARQAALREWELQTAHGLGGNLPKQTSAATTQQQPQHTPLLDGRLFFSAAGSYPMSVFSLIRYEPKKEEMQQRRQKLEALGGGGSQFVMPTRDWRGISYRSLLPRRGDRQEQEHSRRQSVFNRFLRTRQVAAPTSSKDPAAAKTNKKSASQGDSSDHEKDDDSTASSITSASSENSEDFYEPGLLDDPAMVLGRHRNVMIGDRVTGPIVSSTIQFVKPTLLKAELNKKFRDRFDGWEPPRGARKYIGARVIDGEYRLMDPTDDFDDRSYLGRSNSAASVSSASDGPSTTVPKEKQLRIPPSLTLSKIRSLKQQALDAAIKAKMEIGTVALACVYFERLCLDCRVDKSNRRLAFAACLLLASKLNEPNVGLVIAKDGGKKTAGSTSHGHNKNDGVANKLQSLIRPNKRSNNIFASLLQFFTENWNLSLKHLFEAEFGVFAALGFSLHAKPSHVAFHFKRLLKSLEWNPRNYLGEQMYDQWQACLEMEAERRQDRKKRQDRLRRRKEEQILNLRIEMENEVIRRNAEERAVKGSDDSVGVGQDTPTRTNNNIDKAKSPRISGMRLLNRFGVRRIMSNDKMYQTPDQLGSSEHHNNSRPKGSSGDLPASPSMPNISVVSTMASTQDAVATSSAGIVAIDIPATGEDDTSSIGSLAGSDKGIFV